MVIIYFPQPDVITCKVFVTMSLILSLYYKFHYLKILYSVLSETKDTKSDFTSDSHIAKDIPTAFPNYLCQSS